MDETVGQRTADFKRVQKNPDANVMSLGMQASHGIGGNCISRTSSAAATTSRSRWRNEPPSHSRSSKAASDEVIWCCEHAVGRGVMKFHETGAAVVADANASLSVFEVKSGESDMFCAIGAGKGVHKTCSRDPHDGQRHPSREPALAHRGEERRCGERLGWVKALPAGPCGSLRAWSASWA